MEAQGRKSSSLDIKFKIPLCLNFKVTFKGG